MFQCCIELSDGLRSAILSNFMHLDTKDIVGYISSNWSMPLLFTMSDNKSVAIVFKKNIIETSIMYVYEMEVIYEGFQ